MKELRMVADTQQEHNKSVAHKRKKGNTVSWRPVKSNLAELSIGPFSPQRQKSVPGS